MIGPLDIFTDRIRTAVVALSTIDVEKLHHAVRPVGAKIRLPLVLDLVRLAHRQPANTRAAGAFLKELNPNDGERLVAAEQSELISLLAVASLIEAFDATKDVPGATAAALAVMTVKRAGWRAAHPDVDAYAQRWLTVQAQAVRHKEPWPGAPPLLQGAQPVSKDDTLSARAIDREIQKLRAAMGSIASDRESLREAARRNDRLEEEQRGLLWWLLSAQPMGPAAERAVVTAASVVALLGFVPAPTPTDELLRRRLGDAYHEPVNLTAHAPRKSLGESLGEHAVTDRCHGLVPLLGMHLADPSDASVELTVSAGELARGLIDEALLVRVVSEATPR